MGKGACKNKASRSIKSKGGLKTDLSIVHRQMNNG